MQSQSIFINVLQAARAGIFHFILRHERCMRERIKAAHRSINQRLETIHIPQRRIPKGRERRTLREYVSRGVVAGVCVCVGGLPVTSGEGDVALAATEGGGVFHQRLMQQLRQCVSAFVALQVSECHSYFRPGHDLLDELHGARFGLLA